MPQTILFLCTGNYYRSRFAEVVFNAAAARMGLAWRAASRGLAVELGVGNVGPMAKEALQLLAKMNVRDLMATARMPTAVATAELEAAARVIALDKAEHEPLLRGRHPGWEAKVEYWTVADIPGVLPRIEAEVNGLISRLLGGAGNVAIPEHVAPPPPPKKLGTAKVGRETAGRKGKGVTTVFELNLDEAGLKELATRLKNLCGTGGTAKDGRIEIQGDHRDKIMAELEKMGYKAKRVGW